MTAITSKTITLIATKLESGIDDLQDPKGECLDTALSSYEIDVDSPLGTLEHPIGGLRLRAQLFIHDLDSIHISYVNKDGLPVANLPKQNPKMVIVGLAIETLLKHLHHAGCTKQNLVPFSESGQIYNKHELILAQNRDLPNFSEEYTITNATADLKSSVAFVYFKNSTPEFLKKVDSVFIQYLPKNLGQDKRAPQTCYFS